MVFGLGLITDFWSWSCTLWSRSWSHYVLVLLTSLSESGGGDDDDDDELV